MPSLQSDLIFDVGMHLGEDSAFYLQKGYRVVGFEANPDLVAHNQSRFVREIDSGRLVVVPGAIAENAQESISFYQHPTKSVWGTITPTWADRNAHRGESRRIDVDVVDFAAVIRQYGIPWFVKIDIEGADKLCLRTLAEFEERPTYLSIEARKRTGKLSLLNWNSSDPSGLTGSRQFSRRACTGILQEHFMTATVEFSHTSSRNTRRALSART